MMTAAERQDRRDLILAVLEERPYTTTTLGELLRISSGLFQFLTVMAHDGLVHKDAGDRWRLGAGRATAEDSRVDDPEAVDVDEAEDEEDVEQTPIERRRVLRQAAPSNLIPSDVAPSWWTTAPQDGFSRRATIEHRRMRTSKESHFVPFRILQ